MIVMEKKVFICQWTKKKNWSRFRVVLSKEMQGGNINVFRPHAGQLILFILPRNEELPQKIQIKHTDTLN